MLFAKGLGAGTVITNIATLSFELDGDALEVTSNKVEDIVAQLIDVEVLHLDSKYINVLKHDQDKVMTFKVTNTGNGEDTFSLSVEQESKSNFYVQDKSLFIDTNRNNILDANDKEIDEVSFLADESAIVFVSSKIPNIKITEGLSIINLKAVSQTGGSGTAGELHFANGINGVDVIDGLGGGVAEDSWAYVLSGEDKVKLSKGASVKKNLLGETIITYEINVSVLKGEVVHDLVIEDIIPKGSTYQKESLKLGAKSLTDSQDADDGYFDEEDNKVIVTLGTFSYPSCSRVKFETRVEENDHE